MSTYKEIHGVKVQYRDSDATAIEGDVWYNRTTGLLKMYSAVNAWASGNNMNTERDSGTTSATSQSAALVHGGYLGPPGKTVNVESYNGSTWTEIANLTAGTAYAAAAGSETAAIVFGGNSGSQTVNTISWDNSSWTEVGNLAVARENHAGCGSQTAAISFGGSAPGLTAITELYDGTSWTEVNDLNTARRFIEGGGSSTDALGVAGGTPGNSAVVEKWNGTSWSEVGDINTARGNAAISHEGTSTAMIYFGGEAPGGAQALCEQYDGSSWTEVSDLPATMYGGHGSGTATSALSSAGHSGPAIMSPALTNEWSGAASIQTVAFD
jgi:hypothetical protein